MRKKGSVNSLTSGRREFSDKESQENKGDGKFNESDLPAEEINANINKLKNIKELIYIGFSTRKVNIPGFIIELRSLSSNDNVFIYKELMKCEGYNKTLLSRVYTLALVISAINGQPMEEMYEIEEGEMISAFDRKVFILKSMSGELTDHLWGEYGLLIKEAKSSFEVKDIKK